MVAFDFILIFVLLIFAVQLLAGCIERIGFTVQAVQIKLIPHDTIAVFVQYRSFTILVMFENQIFQCSTIVGTKIRKKSKATITLSASIRATVQKIV